jgi:hypothetical protein
MSTPSEARGRTNRDLGDAPTRPSSQSSVLKTGGETDQTAPIFRQPCVTNTEGGLMWEIFV